MLTLQFVPYSEIESLSAIGRIRKLLNIAKQGKIVVLQGRLRREEEAELIKTTMEEINKDFAGIELAVLYPSTKKNSLTPVKLLKQEVVNFLVGDRLGMTIIGPANLVKDIRRDPDKIQLMMRNNVQKRKKA